MFVGFFIEDLSIKIGNGAPLGVFCWTAIVVEIILFRFYEYWKAAVKFSCHLIEYFASCEAYRFENGRHFVKFAIFCA